MKVLTFADNLIWGGNKEEVQEQLNKWVGMVEQNGMKFNIGKSGNKVVCQKERGEWKRTDT